mgnify:CR=1 FL=1
MTKETIEILRSLKTGEIYGSHKPIGKQEIEEQKILSTLHRMNVLKLVKNTYSVGNTRYLSKFNYHNVSQVNQSSGNIDLKSPIEQKINNHKPNNPSKISTLQKLYWVIGILVALTILYEFVIKKLISE